MKSLHTGELSVFDENLAEPKCSIVLCYTKWRCKELPRPIFWRAIGKMLLAVTPLQIAAESR